MSTPSRCRNFAAFSTRPRCTPNISFQLISCLLFLALLSLFGPRLQAQSALTSLTCQPASGPAIVLTVYTLDIDTTSLTTYSFGGVSLNADIRDYPAMIAAVEAGTMYPTCTFSTVGSPITLTDVTFTSAGALGVSGFVRFSQDVYGLLASGTNALALSQASLLYSGITATPVPFYSSIAPIGSIACGSSGTLPVYSYSVEVDEGETGYTSDLTVGTDLGAFTTLQGDVTSATVLPSCTLSVAGLSIIATDLQVHSLSVLGDGAGTTAANPLLYASVDGVTKNALSITGSPAYGSPVTTLTCPASSSGQAGLSLQLYGLDLENPDTAASLSAELSGYAELEAASTSAPGSQGITYSSCTIGVGSALPITLTGVTFSDVFLQGDGGVDTFGDPVYAQASIDYATLSAGGVTVMLPVEDAAHRAAHAKPGSVKRIARQGAQLTL